MPVRIPWAVLKASYFLRNFHPIPDNQRWRGQARVKNPDEREEDRLIGLLTDRDITVRAVAEGLSPMETRAQQVMTSEVEYIFDDYPVEEAARYMSELQVRRLPAVDRDHRLVGIVSLGDLALSEQQSAGAALSSISQAGESGLI